jgi:hypothetical protein
MNELTFDRYFSAPIAGCVGAVAMYKGKVYQGIGRTELNARASIEGQIRHELKMQESSSPILVKKPLI